jgi:hypothetical protein
MTMKWLALIGIVALLALPIGCAGPSRVEMDYGTSVKLAKFNQVLNPEAERDLEPVTGLDGIASQKTIDRYRKDFEKPSPPPSYMFNVITGTSGTGMGQ